MNGLRNKRTVAFGWNENEYLLLIIQKIEYARFNEWDIYK